MSYNFTRNALRFVLVPYNTRLKNTIKVPEQKMKVFTQKKNPITGSTEWDIQHEDYDYHQEIARSAFADMLHDTERNKKYHLALKSAIEKIHNEGKEANVLDIGTGTGLLSMMAVKCGADSVVACEAFKPMADCCAKILKKNGVADKITLIPKKSTEITVGMDGDMKQKANILVTEVFDTELIGEGALSTFTHAHKFLLEKECIVVPDSATVYAQVVECPTLSKWNRLNDLCNADGDVVLKTPQKMKDCPGSAGVHDIQLSQLPRQSFKEISEPIAIFYYDWGAHTPLEMKKVVKQKFKPLVTGEAQVVFMWWDLHMDTDGKILLSCAPWWHHPDADTESERPQNTIPWRDHWMQAVYYLPKSVPVSRNTEVTLISSQDEYSYWFFLENQNIHFDDYKRHNCNCGVHMAYSRTHISYLNDGVRSKNFLTNLRDVLTHDSVVLDLNGSSFMGLAAGKMGAKSVYVLESNDYNIGILEDYAKENGIENVKFISETDDDILKEVTHVICDPNFSSSTLPWENLKMAYLLNSFRGKLREDVVIMPDRCEFWAMPVEFLDLHKIKVPVKKCEGFDISIFDKLVQSSRDISDSEAEAQPLWEYPCIARGFPQRLLEIDLTQLRSIYAAGDLYQVIDRDYVDVPQRVNGFALWWSWFRSGGGAGGGAGGGGGGAGGAGPRHWALGDLVEWDPHTRQAVVILEKTFEITKDDKWSYQVTCDLDKGQFDVKLDLIKEFISTPRHDKLT